MNESLDWTSLQIIAYRWLGLDPHRFWDMTPRELMAMWRARYDHEPQANISRQELQALQQQFPDIV